MTHSCGKFFLRLRLAEVPKSNSVTVKLSSPSFFSVKAKSKLSEGKKTILLKSGEAAIYSLLKTYFVRQLAETLPLLELPFLVTSGLSFTSVQTAGAHSLADTVHPFWNIACCI